MVSEQFSDYAQSGELNFSGWRCLSCGLILDPIILMHRARNNDGRTTDLLKEILAGVGK
jgi:hypothetical protein